MINTYKKSKNIKFKYIKGRKNKKIIKKINLYGKNPYILKNNKVQIN